MDYRDVEPGVERWTAGEEILELTDSLGFNAQAAGWIYEPENAQWKYYLITTMVDEQGPRWIYSRLLKVFAKVNLPPGITPLDIYIASPKDALYKALMAAGTPEMMAKGKSDHPEKKFFRLAVTNIEIAPGVGLARAMFYRAERIERKPKPKLFDKRVEQMLAA